MLCGSSPVLTTKLILLQPIHLVDMFTTNAKIVKKPPVVDVSYCYVWILLKKSNDLSIFLIYILIFSIKIIQNNQKNKK